MPREPIPVLDRIRSRIAVVPETGCHVFEGALTAAHLEAVTQAENNRRAIKAVLRRRTHCRRGHAWTAKNTYVNPGDGARSCRACRAIRLQQKRTAA